MNAISEYLKANQNKGGSPTGGSSSDLREAGSNLKSGIALDSLAMNKDFLKASTILWNRFNPGKPFKGDDAALAEFGLGVWYNTYNLTLTGVDAVQYMSAPEEEKAALGYILNTGDNLEWSVEGVGRALASTAFDPTTYAGLSTFGIGVAARQGAKMIARETLLQAIKKGVTVGATEGAIFGLAQNTIDQNLRIQAGIKEEFSYGELAGNAVLGAGVGGALGGAVGGVTSRLTNPGSTLADDAVNPATAPAKPSVGAIGEEIAPPGLPGVKPTDVVTPQVLTPSNDNAVLGGAPMAPPAEPTVRTPANDNSNSAGMAVWQGMPDAASSAVANEPSITMTDTPNLTVRPGDVPVPANDSAVIGATGVDTVLPRAATPPSPANDVKPSTGNKVIDLIRDISPDTGRIVNQGPYSSLPAKVKSVTDALANTSSDEMNQMANELRAARYRGEEDTTLLAGVKNAYSATLAKLQDQIEQVEIAQKTNAPNLVKLYGEKEQTVKNLNILRQLDTDLGSTSGYNLGMRKGSDNTKAFEDITFDSVAEELGYNPRAILNEKQKQEVDLAFVEKMEQQKDAIRKNRRVIELSDLIQQAGEARDTTKMDLLAAEKQALEEFLLEQKVRKEGGSPMLDKAGKVIRNVSAGVVEVAISNVFSTGSVVTNTIPGLIKLATEPLRDYIVKGGPLAKDAWFTMVAQYSIVQSQFSVAWKAAKMNFQIEQGLLSNSFNAAFEGGAVIPKNIKGLPVGGIVRFFPRINGAMDEVFKQISYRQFVIVDAIKEASDEAASKGLDKVTTKRMMKEAAQKAIDNAFNEKIDYNTAIMQIRKDGISRGYTGDKLVSYIKQTLDQADPAVAREEGKRLGLKDAALDKYVKEKTEGNAALWKEAKNVRGRNFADDFTFSREFSGKGASAIPKFYEGLLNRAPILRLVQLFFRTPVRVMEQGFRLTPGLNLVSGMVAGQFLNDLRGKNGLPAYHRAQGELMMSYAIMMWGLSQYAQGNITGGGSEDWRQRRTMENAKDWKPYTIKVGNSEFNYRNYDPFATPLKVLTNALDAYGMYMYRTAQGEYDDATTGDKILAHMSVASFAIVRAVRDANLTEGFDQLFGLGEDLMDPEANQEAINRFFAQKMKLLVPATWTRFNSIGQDGMNDPLTAEQVIWNSLTPNSSSIPTRYDALGLEVPQDANFIRWLTGIDFTNPAERMASLGDDKRAYVLNELKNMALAVGDKSNFEIPFKLDYPDLGFDGVDLRRRPAPNGDGTLWDAYARELQKLNLTELLYDELKNSEGKLGMGSPTKVGERVQRARKIINNARKLAAQNLQHQSEELILSGERARQKSRDLFLGNMETTIKPAF